MLPVSVSMRIAAVMRFLLVRFRVPLRPRGLRISTHSARTELPREMLDALSRTRVRYPYACSAESTGVGASAPFPVFGVCARKGKPVSVDALVAVDVRVLDDAELRVHVKALAAARALFDAAELRAIS